MSVPSTDLFDIDYATIERRALSSALRQALDPRGRMLCRCCCRPMSFDPTPEEPVRRRRGPHAAVCEDCKPIGWNERLPNPIREIDCCERGCPSAIERLGDLVR